MLKSISDEELKDANILWARLLRIGGGLVHRQAFQVSQPEWSGEAGPVSGVI